MRDLFHRFLKRRAQANVLAVCCALLAGLIGSEIYREYAEEQYRLLLETQAQKVVAKIESETLRSSAMAVASLMGLNEPILKQQAKGERTPDDEACLERLRIARKMLRADGIYVMDEKGNVVAHDTVEERFTGKNFSFRPYWQQAIVGIDNVYPALGTTTNKRGLYVASGIRSGSAQTDSVIGVVVIKLSAEFLDNFFGGMGGKLAMLSPQGIVFASSEPAWLYKPMIRLTPATLAQIREKKQFGLSLEKDDFSLSPILDLNAEDISIDGERYVKAIAPFQLNDPAGRWSLVLLSPLGRAFSITERLVICLFTASIVWIILMMGMRAIRYSIARQEALDRSENVTKELQAAVRMKERHAEFTERMQKARDIASMTTAFFEHLASLIPIHQGSLYFVDAADGERNKLTLAGYYGTSKAPASIPEGEGLIGQCAGDHQLKSLTNVPAGYWDVSTGLLEAQPQSMLIIPVLSGDDLLGVVEIASLDRDFSEARTLIESMLPVLSMNMEILIAERRTQYMLFEAQTSADAYKNWQEAGRQGENWLLMIIDQAPDGIVVIDKEGKIVLSNQAIENMLGYEKAELRGKQVRELLPTDQQAALAGIQEAFHSASERAQRITQWLSGLKALRKDGSVLDVSVSLSSLPSMGLHEPRVCAIVRAEQG